MNKITNPEQRYVDNMIKGCVSDVTARNHVSKLRVLLEVMDADDATLRAWANAPRSSGETLTQALRRRPTGALVSMLRQPDVLIAKLTVAYPHLTTCMSMYHPILALFKFNPDTLAKDMANERAKFLRRYEWYGRIRDAAKAERLPTHRQMAQYTPYDEVIGVYRKLVNTPTPHAVLRDSQDVVLLSMLLHCRPKRTDHARMRVFIDPEKDPDLKEENFIVIRSKSAAAINTSQANVPPTDTPFTPGPDDSYATFVTHKTRDKYRRIDEVLHPVFVRDALDSLRAHPRTHLFINRFRKPFTPNTWSKHFSACAMRLFGRPSGLTMFRHAYTTERLDLHRMAPRRLQQEARLMLHSRALQEQYVFSRDAACDAAQRMCSAAS